MAAWRSSGLWKCLALAALACLHEADCFFAGPSTFGAGPVLGRRGLATVGCQSTSAGKPAGGGRRSGRVTLKMMAGGGDWREGTFTSQPSAKREWTDRGGPRRGGYTGAGRADNFSGGAGSLGVQQPGGGGGNLELEEGKIKMCSRKRARAESQTCAIELLVEELDLEVSNLVHSPPSFTLSPPCPPPAPLLHHLWTHPSDLPSTGRGKTTSCTHKHTHTHT
jgi:hypothetical protein